MSADLKDRISRKIVSSAELFNRKNDQKLNLGFTQSDDNYCQKYGDRRAETLKSQRHSANQHVVRGVTVEIPIVIVVEATRCRCLIDFGDRG